MYLGKRKNVNKSIPTIFVFSLCTFLAKICNLKMMTKLIAICITQCCINLSHTHTKLTKGTGGGGGSQAPQDPLATTVQCMGYTCLNTRGWGWERCSCTPHLRHLHAQRKLTRSNY